MTNVFDDGAEPTDGSGARARPDETAAEANSTRVKRSSRGRRGTSTGRAPRHTRFSAAWAAVTVAVIFGVALIVFVAQNTRRVPIEFFTVNAQVPVAVALLAAALSGAIVVLAVGVGRVTQLRWNLRRQRRRRDQLVVDPEQADGREITAADDAPDDPAL